MSALHPLLLSAPRVLPELLMLACDDDDDEALCDRGVQLMLQLIAMLLVGRALSHSSICSVATVRFVVFYRILNKEELLQSNG